MSHKYSECIESSESTHIFYIGYDLLDSGLGQAVDKFDNELFNDIPAFAFGTNVEQRKIEDEGAVPTVREAMKKMYSIPEVIEAQKEYLDSSNTEDKYIKRGEFGELILYHLLHEYFGADALISKIYFKDSGSIPAHGFDAVHANSESKTLWLGESKLYEDGNRAVDALGKDLFDHFRTDFFNSEFQIITNRIHDSETSYSEWITELVSPETKTLDKLANINIALFAAFNSKSINDYDEETFEDTINEEIEKLVERIEKIKDKHSWSKKLNIYLLLFPLEDKRTFVSRLHQKLKGAQQV